MKIIGVNGSPHANHNTGFLVKKVLEGAGKAGAETMLFHPERMKLRSCKACMACKKRPLACSIKDDMAGFVGAVEEGCGLVIGTPGYFDHVSAQLKMFLDRMYCFLGPDLKNHFPKKARAVLVMTYEADNPKSYESVLTWIEERLKGYYGIETIGSIKLHGSPCRLTSNKDAAICEKAYALGLKLAKNK